jgi:hypothetical protein
LDQLGLPREYVVTGCIALFGFVTFYMVTTCLILRFIPYNVPFSTEVRKAGERTGRTKDVVRVEQGNGTTAGITVRLMDFNLSLQKYFLFRKTTINILQGITVDFEPGKLNVVMGPSGITLCWKLSDVEVLGKAVS